jgi:hypothetical protein
MQPFEEFEDEGFQEGYAIAKYLESHPCDKTTCDIKDDDCYDCVQFAIHIVNEQIETERRIKKGEPINHGKTW